MEFNKSRPDDANSLKLIFRALFHKNYRLFFGGQSISLMAPGCNKLP
jgi:hypothetical protein